MNSLVLLGIGVASLFEGVSENVIWVTGPVVKPGVYAYREGMSVMDSIALARGEIPRVARMSDLKIMRRTAGLNEFKTIRVNMVRFVNRPFDSSENMTLEPGDWIVVGRMPGR